MESDATEVRGKDPVSTSTTRQSTSLWIYLSPWKVETPQGNRMKHMCTDVCEGHALNFSHSVQLHLLSSMHDIALLFSTLYSMVRESFKPLRVRIHLHINVIEKRNYIY